VGSGRGVREGRCGDVRSGEVGDVDEEVSSGFEEKFGKCPEKRLGWKEEMVGQFKLRWR
jgi:hypothetical protein